MNAPSHKCSDIVALGFIQTTVIRLLMFIRAFRAFELGTGDRPQWLPPKVR